MNIQFKALTTELVQNLRDGGMDANGQVAERRLSDGSGQPCRHCLQDIEAGEEYLILPLRPFPDLHPYAELGPIFLHAAACEAYQQDSGLPAVLECRQSALIKGYTDDNRIKYGTGRIVETKAIPEQAADIFEDPDIAYIHVRSALNNCYTCRIDRA
jgi:hypothetical protein